MSYAKELETNPTMAKFEKNAATVKTDEPKVRSTFDQDRAQIFKTASVKFYYIFLRVKVRKRDFEQFAVNLPWHFLYVLINFKMAVLINFEAVTSSNS